MERSYLSNNSTLDQHLYNVSGMLFEQSFSEGESGTGVTDNGNYSDMKFLGNKMSDDNNTQDQGFRMKKKQNQYGLRKGKWTIEEELYTNKVIENFNAGILRLNDAERGTTLRAYLAEKLSCNPMRITKKYTGAACLGKRVYHPDHLVTNSEEVTRARIELDILESNFRRRLEQMNQKRNLLEQNVSSQLVSTPSIDALVSQSRNSRSKPNSRNNNVTLEANSNHLSNGKPPQYQKQNGIPISVVAANAVPASIIEQLYKRFPNGYIVMDDITPEQSAILMRLESFISQQRMQQDIAVKASANSYPPTQPSQSDPLMKTEEDTEHSSSMKKNASSMQTISTHPSSGQVQNGNGSSNQQQTPRRSSSIVNLSALSTMFQDQLSSVNYYCSSHEENVFVIQSMEMDASPKSGNEAAHGRSGANETEQMNYESMLSQTMPIGSNALRSEKCLNPTNNNHPSDDATLNDVHHIHEPVRFEYSTHTDSRDQHDDNHHQSNEDFDFQNVIQLIERSEEPKHTKKNKFSEVDYTDAASSLLGFFSHLHKIGSHDDLVDFYEGVQRLSKRLCSDEVTSKIENEAAIHPSSPLSDETTFQSMHSGPEVTSSSSIQKIEPVGMSDEPTENKITQQRKESIGSSITTNAEASELNNVEETHKVVGSQCQSNHIESWK